jgi:glycosyltransferase involved in cell wall biosynthesis
MISLNSKPVILTILEDINYQKLMGDIDALFIVYRCSGSKEINGALPENHQVIYDLTPNIRPDILLSQNKINQYGIFNKLANKYSRPIFSLYHGLPKPKDIDRTFLAKSDENIFLSKDHADGWGINNPTIIPPTTNRRITKLSEPSVYINRSESFTCFYEMLDKMASGDCVISPAVYEVNNIVKHGYNGFLYKRDTPEKEKEIIQKLGKNDELIMEFGANSQKLISEKFSKEKFTNNWNSLISKYFKGI